MLVLRWNQKATLPSEALPSNKFPKVFGTIPNLFNKIQTLLE
jgi:hypothetical protein